MTETTLNLAMLAVTLIGWILWTFFSDTRHNHGIIVAFLIPLAPIIFIAIAIIFYTTKLILWPIYILRGKRKKYESLIEKIRLSLGFF